MGAGSDMPPLLLEDDEAVAVVVGLRSNTLGGIQGVEESSLRALSKMEQLLPPRLATRVAALQSMVVRAPRQTKYAPPVSANLISYIAGACRDLQQLHFDYADHKGAPSRRTVEPHRLVHFGRRWYLVAWDTARKDWRTFRADRIAAKNTQTGPKFTPRTPPAQDLAEYVSRGLWQAPARKARVKLLAAAEAMSQRIPAQFGIIEPIDKHSCWFETSGQSYESLAMHLVLIGTDFEVQQPAELVEHVRAIAQRYAKACSAA
ncbi:DNA-binding transcriptional regulator [Bryobacterales bacterium F-183]|nr:DNA-binding transcriptional regulator [Bryobacterales bacterium F-183]